MLTSLVVAALALAALGAAAAEPGEVIVLTGETFDEEVKAHEVLLVEFYAPWCGHCKQLEPEYNDAAKTLAEDNLFIAKIDADDDANKEAAQKFGIRGFPTLKVFRNGEFASDYNGGRTAADIVSFMRKQAQPAITELESSAGVADFAAKDPAVVVGFFDKAEGPVYEAFVEAANKGRNDFSFATVVGGDAAEGAAAAVEGAKLPAVVLMKSYDDGNMVMDEDDAMDASTIGTFVKVNSVPLIDEVGPQNYRDYADAGLPLAYIFVPKSDQEQVDTHVERFTPIAKKTKGKMSWVWIDSVQYARHGERLGLSGEKFPALAIEKLSDGTHYAFKEGEELDAAAAEAWIDSFLDGSLAPTVKSEDIPTAEEQAAQAVKKIVAANFDDEVINTDADVFVEFYAPWCGHCKKLAPTWEDLAGKFKDDDKVVIAAIDATANDVDPKLGIQGFPTLKLFKAGAKDTPVNYEGDRSEDDLVKFLATHGHEVAGDNKEEL